MATSSITKKIEIKDAKRFIEAMEEAERWAKENGRLQAADNGTHNSL